MGKIISGLLLLSASLALAGCEAGGKDEKDGIAASTPALAEIAGRIAGDRATIVTLLPPGGDAEHFEPDMATMKRLGDVSVMYHLATPGFERTMVSGMSGAAGRDIDLVDLSRGIEKLTGEHAGGYDPHYLTSPGNARIVARNITKDLSARYPKYADEFRKRGAVFDSLMRSEDEKIRRMLDMSAAERRRPVVVAMHPSVGYFARDYGVRQITLEEGGKEAGPRRLEKKLQEASEAGACILVYERAHSPEQAGVYARRLGANSLGIDFNAGDFVIQYEELARAIAGE